MQDVQNIPPPDISSPDRDNDFGSHSTIEPDLDGEEPTNPQDDVPLPSDREPSVPIQEPPEDKYPVGEGSDNPKQIV